MKNLDVIAPALVIIGALNLGLAGLFHPDVVATLFGMRFGQTSAARSVVYGLVGLSGCIRLSPGNPSSAAGTRLVHQRGA